MTYRADVDGLRAIAVLSVLVFHAGLGIAPGGFVGVDIFFVISGFLITSLIVAEHERGAFSIVSFYERRARRILPALFAMLAATLALGSVILLRSDFQELTRSAGATSAFLSNVFFWKTAGYFNGESDLKPLLHTWSLGVEEQFYIVFPVLVFVGFRLGGRRALGPIVLGSLAASFVLCLWAMDDYADAAFYLAPARAWELMIGAVLALGLLPELRPGWLREAAGAVGLGLILWCVLTYSEAQPFPGTRALWPCVGAALVILAAGSGVSRLLALRPLVFVGLISYSLYLWHWPVLVFARYEGYYAGTPLQAAVALAACGLLAVLSWRYVEEPFRSRRLLPTRRGVLATATACIAGAVVLNLGLGSLIDPDADALAGAEAGRQEARAAYGEGTCFFSSGAPLETIDPGRCLTPDPARRTYLLMGDSFAAHLWPGLSEIAPESVDLDQFTFGGCPPLRRSMWRMGPGCQKVMQAAFHAVKDRGYDVVFLAANWKADELPELRRTLYILKRRSKRVVLFGPMVEYRANLPEILQESDDPERDTVKYRIVPTEEERRMRAMAHQVGVTYVSMLDLMCEDKGRTCLLQDPSGAPIQWDNGHLTPAASRELMGEAAAKGAFRLY